MERNFFGLNSKDSLVVVKEEAVEGGSHSVQWAGPNNISVLPHFMCFKAAQEEKVTRVESDLPAASGFVAVSAADVFDSTHKRPLGEIQHKMLPAANKASSFSMRNSFFKTHFAGAGQNFAGGTTKQLLLGGIPITAPHSGFPSHASVAGTTEPWFNSKSSGAPAQLTIFYGGMVNVYNDISPEKAQAIMFLAGNGSSAAFNMAQPRAQVQVKKEGGDDVIVNQPTHPVGGCTNGEVMAVKQTGVSSPAVGTASPKIVAAIRTLDASAIPQSRQASLARFLEKRKERVMNSAPYNMCKKSAESASPGSDDVTS